MRIQYTYLMGYAASFVLAAFSAVSVTLFLIPQVPPLFVILCSGSCFFLNLILFWRSFPSIISDIKKKSGGAQVKILTFCSSMVIYISSFYSFQELRQSFKIVDVLLPTPLVHAFSLLSALGFYGLYIQDCRRALEDPPPVYLLWCIPLLLSLFLDPIAKIINICVICSYLYATQEKKVLVDIFAAFSSSTLCIFGYGAYIPMACNSIANQLLRLAAKCVLSMGLLALIICDALFSIDACEKFKPALSSSMGLMAMKILAIMNALANSQLSAEGTGFLSLSALMGGVMSYITMDNSLVEIHQDSKKTSPPFAEDKDAPLQLMLFQLAVISIYTSWLHVCHPKQLGLIKAFFSKNVLLSTTRGSIALCSFIGCHMGLASINKEPEKLLGQPKHRLKDSPVARQHDDQPSILARA